MVFVPVTAAWRTGAGSEKERDTGVARCAMAVTPVVEMVSRLLVGSAMCMPLQWELYL